MKRLNDRTVLRLVIFLIVSTALNVGVGIHTIALGQEAGGADVERKAEYLKSTSQELLGAVKNLIGQEKLEEIRKVAEAKGRPVDMNYALVEEVDMKYEWLEATVQQIVGSVEKAKNAKTRAEAEVWLKNARVKQDTARRLVEAIIGPEFVHQLEQSRGAKHTRASRAPDVEERIRYLKDTGQGLLEATKKFIDETRRATGTDHHLVEGLNRKYKGMAAAVRQVEESVEKAKNAKTRAEAEFWLNDARIKENTVKRLAKAIAGADVEKSLEQVKQDQRKPKLKPMTGFSSGILYQMGLHHEFLEEHVVESDPQTILNRAEQDYGEGRAGAGGISLHKSATVLTPIDMREVWGVVFEEDRLILLHGEKRIVFPPLNPEYLALAIRSIYGKEGVIKGELVAEEPNAVVVQTGRDQFGEVVWKKEFLPSPWVKVPVGASVELVLGPGIGVMSQSEPSMERVTYYGPIKNTRMGKVLLEADGLLFTFLTGVDWNTGFPLPPPSIEGYMTYLERSARRLLDSSPEEKERPTTRAKGEKRWWHQSAWLVWVPEEFSLRLSRDGTAFEFVDTRMKLSVWSVDEESVTTDYRELARYSTEHYQDLAKVFPVLKDLEEVTKAVSLVRWLKENNVPVDLSWVNSYKIQEVNTPENIRRFIVLLVPGKSGKPLIER